VTAIELLYQRIAELDQLIMEASAPDGRPDEHRSLSILRASLQALRHCKTAEDTRPSPRTTSLPSPPPSRGSIALRR
jgi:hypothetical protein